MEEITKEKLIEAISLMKTKTGAAAALGVNYKILISLIKEFNCEIEVSDILQKRKRIKHLTFTLSDLERVLNGEKIMTAYRLKMRLFQFGIKNKICERCGLSNWLGKEIPLELHHKNGNNLDNRLENLEILCPNCHAMEPNYRGSNKISHKNKLLNFEKIRDVQKTFNSGKNSNRKKETKGEENKKEKRFCIICGNELNYRQINCCCKECFRKWNTKDIPPKENLIKVIKSKTSLIQVAKVYKVTDNAVRKWLKKYDIDISKYGYRKINKKNT